MGRKPIGKTAMTAVERQRRRRARLRPERAYAALERVWAACPKREQVRFLRELRAHLTAAKTARRAERERALTMKILATWPADERSAYLAAHPELAAAE